MDTTSHIAKPTTPNYTTSQEDAESREVSERYYRLSKRNRQIILDLLRELYTSTVINAGAIPIYDINGSLFFGTAQKALKNLTDITPEIKVVVLDMSEVTIIDMSTIMENLFS